MRKWVRNVTGRCAPTTHPLPASVAGRGGRRQPWKASLCCCSSPALSVDGYQGIRRDVFPVTLWEEKLSCLSNRVWLGCNDAVNVLGEPGGEERRLQLH